MSAILMLSGPREGLRLEIETEVVLGRSPSCSLPLEDGRLSRRHARVWIAAGQVHVEDLGSSNGTLVNGAPLTAPTRLLPGDRVQVGETVFLFEAPTPAGLRELDAGPVSAVPVDEVVPREGLAAAIFQAAVGLQTATSEAMVLARAADEAKRVLKAPVSAALIGGSGGWVSAAVRGRESVEVPRALVKAALEDREVARAGLLACAPLVASGGLPFGILYAERSEGEFDAEALSLLAALGRLAGESFAAQRMRAAPALPEVRLVGSAPAFLRSVEQARQAASGSGPVVFTGETGTGRAHLAQYLHSRSARATGPFVVVDCRDAQGAVDELLFGRASAPGVPPLISAFLLADGGTLLLEGIGGLATQSAQRVARLIERGSAPAPGGGEEPVDVRVMATAAEPPRSLAARGLLEGALARALEGDVVALPPLRERTEDLPILFELFALPLSRAQGKDVPRLSPEALRLLCAYGWPHNVRELRLTAERLALLHAGEPVPSLMLPAEVQEGLVEATPRTLAERVQQLERHAIAEALREAGGKKIRAAELLGISRPTLDKKIEDYQLVVEKIRVGR